MSVYFENMFPIVGQPCYIYLIKLKLAHIIKDEENYKKRKMLDPFQEEQAFGFLIKNKLPPVCKFNMENF